MPTDLAEAPTAALQWVAAQLAELRERGYGNLTIAEQNAFCRLGVLAGYVRQGSITIERGEELAKALMRGEEPQLRKDEAARVNAAPIPALAVDVGQGPKPVTPARLDASLAAMAARNAAHTALRAPVARPQALGVPRARESRAPASRRVRSSAASRDGPSEPPPPPLGEDPVLRAGYVTLREFDVLREAKRRRQESRSPRRFEMHPMGGSRLLNGRRWPGSLVFVEVSLKETAFSRGDPAPRAVRAADNAAALTEAASTERTCERCGRNFTQLRRSHGPLCRDCRNALKQRAYRARKKAEAEATKPAPFSAGEHDDRRLRPGFVRAEKVAA